VDWLGPKGIGFRQDVRYTLLPEGAILVEQTLTAVGDVPALPRLGMRLSVPATANGFHWLGRGPSESYPDRKEAMDVGLWRGKVADQYVPYVRPQENGNKEDCRWSALVNARGDGLLVVAEDAPMAMAASHYLPEDLEGARHRQGQERRLNRLIPRPEVYFTVDWKQMGLGGASCGPEPLGPYLCRPTVAHMRFSLRPARRSSGSLAKQARLRLPVVVSPSIVRDEDGMVRITHPQPDAVIRYTVDGTKPGPSSPLYAGAFFLPAEARVNAIAGLKGLPASEPTESILPAIVPVRKISVKPEQVSADSVEPGEGEAANAFDDNPDTFWHTEWSRRSAEGPHFLVVELGSSTRLAGFEYLPRQGNPNGRVAAWTFERLLANGEWETVAAGRFPSTDQRTRVIFETPATATAFRLRAISEQAGEAWASVAELKLLAPVDKP
jgi:beta-galactosidase